MGQLWKECISHSAVQNSTCNKLQLTAKESSSVSGLYGQCKPLFQGNRAKTIEEGTQYLLLASTHAP